MASQATLSQINRAAIPLDFTGPDIPGFDFTRQSRQNYAPLLEWIGQKSVVLIGEASHGTHDFYRERAQITRLLIEHKGFNAVAIEGDWPDAHRVHRFVTGSGSQDKDAAAALSDFRRFPAWMWRNMDVLAFVDWLKKHNDWLKDQNEKQRAAHGVGLHGAGSHGVGFYGLDLYSMHASMRAVLSYLDKADPDAAKRARYRYACFDHYGEDSQAYGYAAAYGLSRSCEDEAVAQLVELRARAQEMAHRDGRFGPDEYLSAEQNARLVQNAERYYRSMFAGRVESWNVRDSHMAETLGWLRQNRTDAKIVVWAHNSHLGDARATEMGAHGEWNLGQLARENWPNDVYSLGFTTDSGEVTAASEWEAPAERKRVRKAMEGSYEALFHQTRIPAFLLDMHDERIAELLRKPMLERAIGVIYLPRSERASHYFHASLPQQFDAVIHIDRTKALIPMEKMSEWERGELPDTYPFAV